MTGNKVVVLHPAMIICAQGDSCGASHTHVALPYIFFTSPRKKSNVLCKGCVGSPLIVIGAACVLNGAQPKNILVHEPFGQCAITFKTPISIVMRFSFFKRANYKIVSKRYFQSTNGWPTNAHHLNMNFDQAAFFYALTLQCSHAAWVTFMVFHIWINITHECDIWSLFAFNLVLRTGWLYIYIYIHINLTHIYDEKWLHLL